MKTNRQIRGKAGYAAGIGAETLAAWWLRLKGYRVLATRFRSPAGEVDIVAAKGKAVIAVEVKRRPTEDMATFALTAPQVARIRRGLEHYIAHHSHLAASDLRIDAILVAPRRLPVHIVNLQ